MKKLFYFVFVTLFFSLSAFAQTEGINFQGLARNAAGEVLVSQQISLRLSVLLGSESGAVAYVETRLATTNPQGIFSLVVGDGNAISKTGNFSSIDWKTASKFLKVEMDPNAGNNFLMMGTTRMQAVPFAFYAYGVDAENVKGILPLGSGGTGVASISELKTSLAVDQINNTSDASKPISTATQAALTTKANAADVTTSLATKVDKVTGKELSTNDYTTAEKTKLAAITGTNTGDQDLSSYATTNQLATKANAADVTTSLATKVDKVTGKGLSTNDYTTAEKTKLAAITGTNTGDQDLSGYATTAQLATKANTTDLTTSLATKVDKVTGKELSTNDFTTAEKTKLAAITGTNTGDQVNITGNAATATLADNISATTNTTLTSLANLATVGTITSGTISLTTDIATTGNLKAGNNTYPNVLGSDGQFLKTNGSGTLSWASVPSPDLGNYVTTNTTQTIAEAKTFSKDIFVNGIRVGRGKNVSEDNKNTAVGQDALSKNEGTSNTAIGQNALLNNTSGAANTAIGASALQFNVSGASNTAIGLDALRTNLGSENTAVGRDALRGSASSSANTAIGYRALRGMSGSGNTGSLTGTGNTAVGKDAGINITTGSNNITIGGGDAVVTGSSNTLVGVSAQVSSASTSNATAIGFQSKSAVEGTAIGNYAFALASKATALGNGAIVGLNASNSTAIGNGATVDASNATAIGNGAIAGLNASNSTAIGYGAHVSDPNTIQLGADGNTDIGGVPIPAVTDVKTSGAITAGGKIIAGASSAASSSAVLEANSTTQGFLPPRLTTTQRDAIATPAEGLTLWNTTNKQLEVFDGSYWVNMAGKLVHTLKVGDTYGGGKVAYIFTQSDPGYVAKETHGLIAATSDQSTGVPWSEGGFPPNPQTISTGARGTAIGTGLSNTNTIIGAVGPSTSYAVGLARAHNGGGYTDWYLPSKDELYKLYLNRSAIGGFSGTYWSSTEYDQYDAWILVFGSGTQDYMTKHLNSFKVRAVRTF